MRQLTKGHVPRAGSSCSFQHVLAGVVIEPGETAGVDDAPRRALQLAEHQSNREHDRKLGRVNHQASSTG